jgi:hypothetical protein
MRIMNSSKGTTLRKKLGSTVGISSMGVHFACNKKKKLSLIIEFPKGNLYALLNKQCFDYILISDG